MLVVQDAIEASECPRGVIATIGNYDGIHIGQRSVLELVRGRAKATGLLAAAVTFDPHPLRILRPQKPVAVLTTVDQKEALLDQAGMDVVYVVRFTPEFSRTPARSFVRDFLHEKLDAKEIYVGSRFVFGYQRGGDLSLLQQMGDSFGFSAFAVDEVGFEGEAVSSTRIRTAIREGNLETAGRLLGRPYSLVGIVARGAGLGRELGWPTVNLATDNELLPANGVYASRIRFRSRNDVFEAVTNIGTRPTLYRNLERVVESHVLGFDRDVYGERAELFLYERIREERKFPNIQDLKAQIERDVEESARRLENCEDLETVVLGLGGRRDGE